MLGLNVGNVAHPKNGAPPNAVFGNAAILPLPGTQRQLNLKDNFLKRSPSSTWVAARMNPVPREHPLMNEFFPATFSG